MPSKWRFYSDFVGSKESSAFYRVSFFCLRTFLPRSEEYLRTGTHCGTVITVDIYLIQSRLYYFFIFNTASGALALEVTNKFSVLV